MLIAQSENQIPVSPLHLRNNFYRLSAKISIGLLQSFALNFYLPPRVVNSEITEKRLCVIDADAAEISRAGGSSERRSLIKRRVILRISAGLTVVEKRTDFCRRRDELICLIRR